MERGFEENQELNAITQTIILWGQFYLNRI